MLNADAVLSLAPDVASAKAGKTLAVVSSWVSLGSDGVALWGECKGSGALPYQARVELESVGYKCSCPSRKFPCKHVLGLLLLAAGGNVAAGTPPPWVATWLAARIEKRDAPAAAPRSAKLPDDAAASAAAAAKRAAAREARVAAGVHELEMWLFDLVRLGLARVQNEPLRAWDARAARLVDAQAPGLARRVRALGAICASGHGWETRLLDALGAIYLLCEAYGRIDTLSDVRRADVRRYIGWTQREDETILREGATVADTWTVLGTRSEEDERLMTHRTWLRGVASGRDALVLQFAPPGAPIGPGFVAGSMLEARFAYFEASVPQRVAIAERGAPAGVSEAFAGTTVDEALASYASHVAIDPWFETCAVTLAITATLRARDEWFVRDAEQRVLPVSRAFAGIDALHALCGGNALVLAGEWNGRALQPLGVWSDGRYVALR